jgi:lipoate-protein ligase A
VSVLRYPDPDARRQAAVRLERHATTLEQSLGRIVAFDEAAGALIDGFTSALDWSLEPGSLTSGEASLAQTLETTRYLRANPVAPVEGAAAGRNE